MVVGLGEELDPAPIIQICAPSGLCCHALVDGQNGGSAPIEDGYTTLLDPLANALSGRVGRAHCCARPPQNRTCTFPCIRLKQAPWARWRAEVPGSCCSVRSAVGVSVQETEFSLVRRSARLGSSCSRPGTGPSSRSAYQAPCAWTRTGFPRSALTRYGRVGCLLDPGDGGALPAGCRARSSPAASQRPVPAPRATASHRGATLHEASTEVHAIHPSGLPLACSPRMGREPSGVSLCSAPRRYRQRTTGQGQA